MTSHWPVGRHLDLVGKLTDLGIEVSDGFSVRHAGAVEPPIT